MSKENFKKIKFLRLLIFIFFASGFSSLVYQVAWQRILTLYYSVESISTTLIVSVYMLGLGFGAIVGGYLSDKIKHRLKFYLFIELLIGLFGFISIPFLEFLGKSTAGSSYTVSFICMFSFLCLPTFLMGMTLPLLTKITNSITHNFLFSVSYLYFINTFGAAIGALISSYILISLFGLDVSVYFAASINIFLGILIFISRKYLLNDEQAKDNNGHVLRNKTEPATGLLENEKFIYSIVFVTGFIAIGYELVWFRIITILVKSSPYAFSSVLFIYLLGIALGSYFMNRSLVKRKMNNKKNAFFLFQILIGVYAVFSIATFFLLGAHVEIFSKLIALSFNEILHPSLKNPSLRSVGSFVTGTFILLDVLIWPLFFVFVPTLFMGASFPLITSLAYKTGKAGKTVGNVYFFNVLGNVTGGLFTGLVLLNTAGTEHSIEIFSFVGLLFLFFIKGKGWYYRTFAKILIVSAMMTITLIAFPKKHELYGMIHGDYSYDKNERKLITEDLDGVIVTYSYNEKLRTYINGLTHGGRPIPIFYFEAIEALSHVAQLRNVLIIGFGTGSTTETILKLNPKPRVTLVELNKGLIKNLEQIDYLNDLLKDDHLNMIFADGRKYLYNTNEKFDAIFIDPLRATTSFSNNLYSKQFYQLIKKHLDMKGVFMNWMDETHIIPKTISAVFPYVKQYSFFCLASNSELVQNTEFKYKTIDHFPQYRNALLHIDSNERSPLSRFTIQSINKEYPVNEDYKPRCEYFIGLKYINHFTAK